MKLQNNNGQFRLTIPKDLVNAKGWDQGTDLVIALDTEGRLVIQEIRREKKG